MPTAGAAECLTCRQEYKGWPNLDGPQEIGPGPIGWAMWLAGWHAERWSEATHCLVIRRADAVCFQIVVAIIVEDNSVLIYLRSHYLGFRENPNALDACRRLFRVR